MSDDAKRLASWLHEARSVVLFTGAGISTESGIDDFRSPGGVWTRMTPIPFDTFCNNEDARLEDWRRRFHFQAQFEAAPLNAGHEACTAIMAMEAASGLITQNIDGLHQRAGVPAEQIVELHGNGTRGACLDCAAPMTLAAAQRMIEETGTSPRCTRCGGLVKAAVISFGQPMPQNRVARAAQLAQASDLFIVLGSSLVVQPAARLPEIAARSDARLVIVNRDDTPLDNLAQLRVNDSIGAFMTRTLDEFARC